MLGFFSSSRIVSNCSLDRSFQEIYVMQCVTISKHNRNLKVRLTSVYFRERMLLLIRRQIWTNTLGGNRLRDNLNYIMGYFCHLRIFRVDKHNCTRWNENSAREWNVTVFLEEIPDGHRTQSKLKSSRVLDSTSKRPLFVCSCNDRPPWFPSSMFSSYPLDDKGDKQLRDPRFPAKGL